MPHRTYAVGMELLVAVLCDAAGDYGGTLNLIGVRDTLYARQFPVVHQQCALALRFCFFSEDEGEHKLTIRLLNADGQPVVPPIEPRVNIRLGNDVSFMTRNMILNLQGLGFPEPGEYAIQVANGDRSLAEIPLRVVQVANENPAEQAPPQG